MFPRAETHQKLSSDFGIRTLVFQWKNVILFSYIAKSCHCVIIYS